MMKEAHFEASPGISLYERRMLPAEKIEANVVLIHGYGDHCSRYEWVMERFCEARMAVFSYDQRGHGRSPGRRGYIYRFEDFLDDLDAFLAHIKPDLPDAPLFFMGHSMGGMVLARYAQTREVRARGLVFSSPFLAFSDDVPAFLVALGPYIAKIMPWMPIGNVDNKGLSRDPEVIAAADADPLCYHGRVAANTGAEFYRMIQEAEKAAQRIVTPMLVLHGGQDRIVSPSGSKMLHQKAGARDKSLHLFPEGYHELFNDLDKEPFMEEIVAWIKARL